MRGPEIADTQSLTNLLRNAGFERWVGGAPPYWTLTGAGATVVEDAADYYIGGRAAVLTRAAADAALAQNIVGQTAPLAFVQGKTFTFSAHIKPGSGLAILGLDDGVTQTWSGYPTDTTDFGIVSVTMVVSLAATKLEAVCKVKDVAGSARFDACMLTEGYSIPAFAPNPLDYQDPQISDTTAPTTPTGLTASAGPLAILLAWTANTEADIARYDVQRADDVAFTTGVITWTVNATRIADIPQTTETRYYRIRAVRQSEAVSAWSTGVSGAATDVEAAGLVAAHEADYPHDDFLTTVSEGDLDLSDVVTGDVSVSRHGFLPTLPNNAGQVFLGSGVWEDLAVSGVSAGWVVTPGYAAVTEFDPETADATTVARTLGTLIDLLLSGLRPGA